MSSSGGEMTGAGVPAEKTLAEISAELSLPYEPSAASSVNDKDQAFEQIRNNVAMLAAKHGIDGAWKGKNCYEQWTFHRFCCARPTYNRTQAETHEMERAAAAGGAVGAVAEAPAQFDGQCLYGFTLARHSETGAVRLHAAPRVLHPRHPHVLDSDGGSYTTKAKHGQGHMMHRHFLTTELVGAPPSSDGGKSVRRAPPRAAAGRRPTSALPPPPTRPPRALCRSTARSGTCWRCGAHWR